MIIQDNGRGFASGSPANGHAPQGFGLRGLRERAHLLGGQVSSESAPGKGMTVRIQVPCDGSDKT